LFLGFKQYAIFGAGEEKIGPPSNKYTMDLKRCLWLHVEITDSERLRIFPGRIFGSKEEEEEQTRG